MAATMPAPNHLAVLDQHHLAELGFGEHIPLPFLCVHHAFEHHTRLQPHAIAAEHLDDRISYAELDRSANSLANALRAEGVLPGSRVSILVQRSIHMLVGILAVLKAGGTYVPLDAGVVTQSTLEVILRDSQSVVVLALKQDAARAQSTGLPIVPLDDVVLRGSDASDIPKPEDKSSPGDSICYIYTTGTDDQIRGIDITHANIVNLVCLSPMKVGMEPGRRVGQSMDISSDLAAWEILGSLSNGSTLCIRGNSSKQWRELMKAVDVAIAVPSVMMSLNPDDYPNLKFVVSAGDDCPQSLADAWAERATFFVAGGHTETTIANTMRVHVKGSAVNVGRPTPNNSVYILDNDLISLPKGKAGVIWAGGLGLSRGYVNSPENTAEKFKLDPYRNGGGFMFNTGVIGRWLDDGCLENLGHSDDEDDVETVDRAAEGSATNLGDSGDSLPRVYDGTEDIYLPSLTLNGGPTPTSGRSSMEGGKTSASHLEKALPWEGYKEDHIPEKTQGKVVRNLRHQIFDLYRRLFSVVFVANLGIFIATVVRGSNANHLGLIVLSNLFVAILMRQEYVVNAFFTVFTAVPRSWPLSVRRVAARVYHIGGIHSGAGVSGTLWLIYFVVQATIEVAGDGPTSIATLVVSYIILLELFVIVALAHPTYRRIYHDSFEAVHRFLGWTAVALVWAQVILLNNDYRPRDLPLRQALIHSAPFWLVVVMTASIILPWLRLRKVNVRSEVLSNHALRIHYDYVTPIPGTFTRVSDNPLMEWHGAGDWTSHKIANPPQKIWIRGLPTCGVMNIVPMFRRLIIVATGSGIAPCAPHVFAARLPIRLLWTSPNVRETFGNELVDALLDKEPNAVIYDTRLYGKPDMVKLTYRMFRDFNAEAVCIISNEPLTRKVVYGLTSRGIPAFGAIWDS
ncbi:nonribosomal peptide synthetase 12 [Auriscalpium vulgare]|uniref:Nonribosomal peptide synthetase 12 n=1 Tax=Auriscalpium vulgare TaxID=40419 RepID=A0ACB8S2T7_9AGAM|nr:nonribosomal peptide synthetase 12 [Auriscalpium vulgare]